MPLQKRIYDFPFVGGERQDIDARVLPFGTLKRVENRRYTKDGRLARRFGFGSVAFADTAGVTVTDHAVRLATLAEEKVVVGKQYLYSQLPSTPSDRWANRGYHPRAGHVTRQSVSKHTGRTVYYPGVAYNAGYRMYAWMERTNLSVGAGDGIVVLVDDETGAVVFRETFATDVWRVKVVAVSTYLYVIWEDRTAAAPYLIKARQFDTADTTPTGMGGTTTIASDLAGGAAFDADVLGTSVYIAWHQNAGSQRIEERSATMTLLNSNTTTDAATNGTMAVSTWSFSGPSRVWMAYSRVTPDTRYAQFTTDLSVRNGPFTLDAAFGDSGIAGTLVIGPISTTAAIFYWHKTQAVGSTAYDLTASASGNSSGVVSAVSSFYHMIPASRPFIEPDGGGQYIIFLTVSIEEFQGLYALCDCRRDVQGDGSYHIPQPEAFFGIGEVGAPALPSTSGVALVSGSRYHWAGSSIYETVGGGAISYGEHLGVAGWDWDFLDVRRFLPVQARDALGWSGGLPSAFDGNTAHEMGFAWHPEAVRCDAVDSASAGGLTSGGVYTYYFVYEWYDAKGQRHLSRPGPIGGRQITLGAGKTAVDLRIQSLTLTNKWRQNAGPSNAHEGTRIRVLIYRNDNAGTVWHLVQSTTLDPPVNDPTTHSVTFTDTLAFSAIQVNEPLYITDGSVPNDLPGSMWHIVQHRDRLFGCSGDTLYWTKRITPNGRAVEWSSLFAMRVIPGVEIQALASFDAVLVIFTEDAVHLLGGDGPEDDGSGQPYAPPEPHSSDVGCIEPRSLALTREGLVFQSKRGLEILPRGGGPSVPIGDAVVDELTTYPEVTSAVVEPSQTQVRFAVQNAARNAARVLCWDYSLPNGGGWSTYSSADMPSNNSAVMWGDRYSYVRYAAATLWQETRAWTDFSGWITTAVETGDVRLNGLNGFGRIYESLILGEHRAPHKFKLEVSLDGGLTWTTTPFEWNFVTVTAGAEMVLSHHNRVQRTSQARYRLTDAQASAVGGGEPGPLDSEGCVLHAMSLVYGATTGPRRVQTSLRR